MTVNDSSTTRQGERYGAEISADNSSSSVRVPLTITAAGGSNNTQSVETTRDLPAASQAYIYDQDGNLLSDGIWEYTWDAENRLNSAEYLLATTDAEKRKFSYLYDYKSRRILRRELHWDSAKAGWYAQHQTKYIYNGWNVIAEILNEATVSKTYTWGTDLSGTMQGAGGVGGLLSVSDQILAIDAAYLYDGNGNVTGLVEKGTDNLIAEYEYTAFGETLTAKGSYASQNTYRFSTKPLEKETGFYYYGYRYYNPVTGTWPSRDPLGEIGHEDHKMLFEIETLGAESLNPYVFVENKPVYFIDILGEGWWSNFADWLSDLSGLIDGPSPPVSDGQNEAIIAAGLTCLQLVQKCNECNGEVLQGTKTFEDCEDICKKAKDCCEKGGEL